ncbi:MAG: hypothetical protein DRP71_02775 [Verrucomicrobia bacterium]|nr:MAG: hypothetical protein DRP71_02775 [Verrucomicrobiota bacterium]
MKTAFLFLVIAGLSACANIKPVDSPSGGDYAATTGPQKQTPSNLRKNHDRPEIEQRAKSYENEGYSPEEARAMAEIEYLKTAK